MTKKKLISIASTVLAVIMGVTMALVSHNNIKKAENMNTLFAENLTELLKIADEIVDANKSGRPNVLNFVRENKSRAVEAVNNLRTVCDYFEKVNVPKSLKDELVAVRTGIPAMRTFLDKYENMFHDVMLESEFLSYVHEMSVSVTALQDDGSFIYAEQNFMRKLKSLRQRSSRYNRFMWL